MAGHDEVAEFFRRFRSYAEEAARRHFSRDSGWNPRQKDVADALSVNESTITHWFKGERFPRQRLVASVLKLTQAGEQEKTQFLHMAREARELDRARKSGTAPHETTRCPISDEEASIAPARLDKAAEIVPDIDSEAESTLFQERGAGMAATTRTADAPQLTPAPSEGDAGIRLAHAADALARKLRAQWDEEAASRGLDIPPPIPVRWNRTHRPLTGPVSVAVGDRDQPGRLRFPPLPGASEATTERLDCGGLGELYAAYAGLGSGRIVLMGPYGSGKTATAILLLLDALDYRVRLSPGEAASTPVPVLVSAREWDPRRQSLPGWFARQLSTDYDFLQSPEYGPDAAGELVRTGRVSLLLDDFDQMDPSRQVEALRHINRLPRTFRLVVLARTDAFAAAVQAETLHLHGALALELAPVGPDQAIRYLQNHQPFPLADGDPRKKLVDQLQHHPDAPVSRALDTPLNLTLIREDLHATGQLLEPGRFAAREDAEEYLLSRVVPAAYGPNHPPGPPAEQARRWLSFLAVKMSRNDLAWWRMHHWMPMWERCVFNTLAGLILTSCLGALIFGPLGHYAVRGQSGALFGAVYGAGMGALFGLLATLVSELRDPHPRWTARLRSVVQGAPERARRRPFAVNPAVALTILLVVTMAVGNQNSYAFGLLAGIVAACTTGYAATRIRPTSSAGSWWRRFQPGWTDLLAAATVGLPIGLAYGLTKTTLHGAFTGVITGFAFGLMVSVIRPVADADSPPTPDMVWRNSRSRALMIGLTAAIPISLVLGFQNGRTNGLLAGVIAAAGFGLVIALGTIAAVSDLWRTSLVFAQLWLRGLFPLRGMRFLNDARDRHVLRTAGPKFQFKHDRLRTALTSEQQRSQDLPEPDSHR